MNEKNKEQDKKQDDMINSLIKMADAMKQSSDRLRENLDFEMNGIINRVMRLGNIDDSKLPSKPDTAPFLLRLIDRILAETEVKTTENAGQIETIIANFEKLKEKVDKINRWRLQEANKQIERFTEWDAESNVHDLIAENKRFIEKLQKIEDKLNDVENIKSILRKNNEVTELVRHMAEYIGGWIAQGEGAYYKKTIEGLVHIAEDQRDWQSNPEYEEYMKNYHPKGTLNEWIDSLEEHIQGGIFGKDAFQIHVNGIRKLLEKERAECEEKTIAEHEKYQLLRAKYQQLIAEYEEKFKKQQAEFSEDWAKVEEWLVSEEDFDEYNKIREKWNNTRENDEQD